MTLYGCLCSVIRVNSGALLEALFFELWNDLGVGDVYLLSLLLQFCFLRSPLYRYER